MTETVRQKNGRDGIKITWKGTACFELEACGERILFDPFVELIGGDHPNTIDEFLHEDTIFITHGHFDHLFFVPQILEQSDATVFCTECPAETIARYTDETDYVAQIRAGQTIPIGKVSVKALKARHIVFDRHYLNRTLKFSRILRYLKNIPFLLYANHEFKEGNETVAYEIRAEGRTILLLGSLALAEEEPYPEHADLLILPYQGNNDLEREAAKIIERLQPRRILLSHFDNAFPPISRTVDISKFKKMMEERWPQIKVVKPTYGKTITLF